MDWSRCLTDQPATQWIRLPDSDLPLSPALNYRLTSEITTAAIVASGGRHRLLHAAGVSTDQGEVAALVGGSGAGKTTAAIALCRAGWGYVTDELVAVDRDGIVRPFPKPLSVVAGPNEHSKQQVGPDHLGLGRAPQHLTLRRVVLLRRDSRGQPARLSVPPGLDAVAQLAAQASGLLRQADPLAGLAGLVSRHGVVTAHYTESTQLPVLINDALERPVSALDWEPLDLASTPSGSGWQRGRVLGGITADGSGLILVGHQVFTLGPVGLAIWLSLTEPLPTAELTRRVRRLMGPHRDSASLVAAALPTMAGARVIGKWGVPNREEPGRSEMLPR